MVDPTTANVGLFVPIRGTDVGTWDVPVNANFTSIDAMAGGISVVALSSASVTLGASQAINDIIRFTGTITGNITVTFPSSIIKSWTIEDQTTGASGLTVICKVSGGVQQIGCPPFAPTWVYSDGTNMKYKGMGAVGTYLQIASSAVPTWITSCTIPPYLNCDGTAFSSATYPGLARQLGLTSTPDARGRALAALNQGTGRLVVTYGPDGDVFLSGGGSDRITLTNAQLSAHTHNVVGTTSGQSQNHVHAVVGDTGTESVAHTHQSNDAPNKGAQVQGGTSVGVWSGQTTSATGTESAAHTHAFNVNSQPANVDHTHSVNFASQIEGGGLPHANVQPTLVAGMILIRAA